ncbi:MAG TPA: polysaccharide biosynthesis C-terminal domain-containing protein [Steroidobacteraceae bacterium]
MSGRAVSDALAFALFVVLARAFGPEGAGIYAFNFAIATILYEIVALGVEEYGVREFSRDPDNGPRLIGRLLKVQIAFALLGCAVLALLSPTLLEAHPALLALMVLYQLALAAARTLFIPAFVNGHLAVQTLGEIVARSGALLFAVLVTQHSATPSLTRAVVGLPLFVAGLLILALSSAVKHGGLAFAGTSLKDDLSAMRPVWSFAASNLLSSVYARTGIVVLFLMLGESTAGLFSSAFKFMEVGWTVLALVPWAGYPLLVRAFVERSDEFHAIAKHVLHGTLLCGALMAWGLFWVVPWLIGPLLGSDFSDAVPVLKALAGIMVLVAISEYLERLLIVADLRDARLRILALQTVLNVALNLVLIPWMGIFGTVVAFALTQFFTIGAFYSTLRSRTPLGWAVRDAGLIGMCILLAIAIGGAMLNFELRPGLAAAGSLLGVILAALAMFAARFSRNARGSASRF